MRKLIGLLFLIPALELTAQNSFEVHEASIVELQGELEAGRLTSVQLVDSYLARIEAYDKQGPALNSIVRINSRARQIAADLDAERASSGPRSQLHGIPILVKDNYNTTSMPTTGGSVALANFVPSANAAQIDSLIEAGAIILAKTNLHEYAYGITSIGSVLGQTRNPYDIRRVPGGSSGGTGAAVAASFGAIGLGSDTCGSIRIPSAFNNLIGLRPSKGLSSIYGVMPLSHTQDVAGPLARSSEDLAILLDLVVGFDSRDEATSVMQFQPLPQFQANLRSASLDGIRLGKLPDYFERADSSTRNAIEDALDWYQQQGAEVVEVEIPDLGELIAASGLIGFEFKPDLNQYLALFLSDEILNLDDIVDQGLYHEAVAAVLTRSQATVRNDEAYQAALAGRDELRDAIERIFDEFALDAIVYPPIAQTPVFIGESQPGNNCSISANSGLPALSMQVGFSSDGLPVGMELLGRHFEDSQLLALAYPYEQAMQPRRSPTVTPPLIDGKAPGSQLISLEFSQQGVQLQADFEVDIVRNSFSYDVNNVQNQGQAVTAAVLLIDGDDFELNDPVVLNLLGPDRERASGEYFMNPKFRQALAESRVYIKVFAEGFPVSGLSQVLQ